MATSQQMKYFGYVIFYCPCTKYDGKVIFSVSLSVHQGVGRGTLVRTPPPPHSPCSSPHPGQDQDRGTSLPLPCASSFPWPRPGQCTALPDTTCYGQDTPRAVRLLQSRRRTVHQKETSFFPLLWLFQSPLKYEVCTQEDENGCWHIPYDDRCERLSYQLPNSWLCVRRC